MIKKRKSAVAARNLQALALAAACAAAPGAALARYVIDDSRTVIVSAPPQGVFPHLRDCPTCYKGHDFGRGCFQNVWTGFEQVWTNVCI